MYVTPNLRCIMVYYGQLLARFAISKLFRHSFSAMSRLFKSAGDPTSQLSDSLVSSTRQGGSGCIGVALLRNHSWHSYTPPLHLVVPVRLAASAFPRPPLPRDVVWGSVLRCCCWEPANPARTQTLIHKPLNPSCTQTLNPAHTQMPQVQMSL